MGKHLAKWLERTSLYLCLGAVMAYLVVFLFIVLSRIRFPFELEWMEGSSWTQVLRILSGQPVYTAPTLDYVPLVYTPLYFYLSAAVYHLLGGGFFPLRLVSLLASVGCILLVALMVWEKTRSGLASFLAAGLFIACYGLSDTWFDLARIDMLFLFFYLLGIFCLRGRRLYSFLLAGVFFSLSFFTKQTALFFIIPIVLFALILMQRRSAVALLAVIVLLIGGSTLLMDRISAGWYSYYVFDLPRLHAFSIGSALLFWLKDMLPPFAVTGVIGIYYLLALRHPEASEPWRGSDEGAQKKMLKAQELFYPVVVAALVAGSWAARANVGGAVNTLLPAFAGMALLLGLAAAHILGDERLSPNAPLARRGFVTAVCLLQFLVLAYNPFSKIPTQSQLEDGSRLVATIRQIDGEVFIPSHNYLNVMAGKPSDAHNVPIQEVAGAFGDKSLMASSDILRQYAQTVQQKRFAAVILDTTDTELFAGPLQGVYHLRSYPQFEQEDVFFGVFAGKPKTALKFYFP